MLYLSKLEAFIGPLPHTLLVRIVRGLIELKMLLTIHDFVRAVTQTDDLTKDCWTLAFIICAIDIYKGYRIVQWTEPLSGYGLVSRIIDYTAYFCFCYVFRLY
jgi:hypothetical protein